MQGREVWDPRSGAKANTCHGNETGWGQWTVLVEGGVRCARDSAPESTSPMRYGDIKRADESQAEAARRRARAARFGVSTLEPRSGSQIAAEVRQLKTEFAQRMETQEEAQRAAQRAAKFGIPDNFDGGEMKVRRRVAGLALLGRSVRGAARCGSRG